MTETEALYALRLGWKNMVRMTKMSKSMRERAKQDRDFTFRAKPVPGWLYYPATDHVEHEPTP